MELEKYDRKNPFIVVSHGNCIDGGFSNYVTCIGLTAMGFNIAKQIPYFHNMDNFSKHMDTIDGKYVMFLDVTPLPQDYINMQKRNTIVSFIDHHPIDSKKEPGKSQLELFKKDKCNYISITDRSQCGTTLACHVFNPSLLSNPLVHHINKFDNCFLDNPITKSVGIYNRFHMNDENFYEKILGKPFIDIVKEGQILEEADQKKVSEFIKNGITYELTIESDKKVKIMETLVDDELYANSVADEFYNTSGNDEKTIVITRFYPLRGGTKFSFRSKEIDGINNLTANDMASRVGGGGHKHSSGYLHKDKLVDSFVELIK
ncbi:MAG: hypothetical protein Edafosvirus35_6 [Edafosvirus sp.]|uniref:Uncharacterized protein n=1 Tax=Edafosvirus sp. TaxID=2487765 RepID=A0A3G4ZZM4_9VIRU|nr:MAG: hypothetical protein Edafosvirus35_6 [Edafosvirus sp.]